MSKEGYPKEGYNSLQSIGFSEALEVVPNTDYNLHVSWLALNRQVSAQFPFNFDLDWLICGLKFPPSFTNLLIISEE